MQARAISFGNWFPVAFPSVCMRKTKFHMLVYTIPEMVVRRWSLGLTTEQMIEVLHAV